MVKLNSHVTPGRHDNCPRSPSRKTSSSISQLSKIMKNDSDILYASFSDYGRRKDSPLLFLTFVFSLSLPILSSVLNDTLMEDSSLIRYHFFLNSLGLLRNLMKTVIENRCVPMILAFPTQRQEETSKTYKK